MTAGYRWASVVAVGLFLLVTMASYQGWGLPSDAQALARSSSVRGGGMGSRSHYGGGPGFGK